MQRNAGRMPRRWTHWGNSDWSRHQNEDSHCSRNPSLESVTLMVRRATSIIAVTQKGISMVRSLFAPVVDFSPTTFSEPFTKGCIGQSLWPLFLRSNPPQRRSLKDDYKASQIGKFSIYGECDAIIYDALEMPGSPHRRRLPDRASGGGVCCD